MRRPHNGVREVLGSAELCREKGLLGDNWHSRGSSRTRDGKAHPGMQLALMNSRVIDAIAGSRERWPLAGNQLFVDLDLTPESLPEGARMRVGSAVVEISPTPHTGCRKFVDRFGLDAMRFVGSPAGKSQRLRGIYVTVVTSGSVNTGDRIVVQHP